MVIAVCVCLSKSLAEQTINYAYNVDMDKKRISFVHYDDGGCIADAPQSSVGLFFSSFIRDSTVSPCRMQNASPDEHSFPISLHASSRMFVCVDFVFLFRQRIITWTLHDGDGHDETTDFYRSPVHVGRRTVGDHRLMYSHLISLIFHVLFRGTLSISFFSRFSSLHRGFRCCHWAILMITFGSRCSFHVRFGAIFPFDVFCADTEYYSRAASAHSYCHIYI